MQDDESIIRIPHILPPADPPALACHRGRSEFPPLFPSLHFPVSRVLQALVSRLAWRGVEH